MLPKEQLELLGAIGTNIMGCHCDALETPEFGEVQYDIVYIKEPLYNGHHWDQQTCP